MIKHNHAASIFNVETLYQSIARCLDDVSRLCVKLSHIDQVNIIVESLNLKTTLIGMIDIKSNQKNFCQIAWDEDQLKNENLVNNQVSYYNPNHTKSITPNQIDPQFYQDSYYCYHVPLCNNDNILSAIEFIKTSGGDFIANETVTFNQLSLLVENIFESLSRIEYLEHENTLLNREHLKDHILVDVTNVVISTHNLDNMIRLLSKELIEFFAIDYIGFILPPDTNNKRIPLHSTYYSSNGTSKTSQQFIDNNSLFEHLNQSQLFDLDSISQENEAYPYIENLQNRGLTELFCIPLPFNVKKTGSFLLAHHNHHVFNRDNIKLFQHIADRIIIAIDNIQIYKNINALNNSLTNENSYLSEEILAIDPFKEIVGSSPAIQKVFEQVAMVAKSNSSVLLLGETGTGKELFAKIIHQHSLRKDKRMIKINCSAVPANLLESELFGHEKGAFTGATGQRIGRFELAQGSTLLLDEIGDIPLELQPKLLRVLQEKEIERLGSNKPIPIDVRIISATNSDLSKMIANKQFRADLFYRLNVFPIILPPLRDREGDIPQLVQFFIEKFSHQLNKNIKQINEQSLKLLCDYHWPGNVRELANVIERAVILNKGPTLQISQSLLCPDEQAYQVTMTEEDDIDDATSSKMASNHREQLRQHIIKVLKETNGVVAGPKGAANRLGLKRTTLLSRMQRLGISAKDIIFDD